MTASGIHNAILTALQEAGVYAVHGPADVLPTGADGRVGQAAVVWPSPRLNAYTRADGGRSGGMDRATVICVGATVLDAVAVADKVDAALGGLRLSDKGGTLRQTVATSPAAEPNANPVRVSMAIEYAVVTKGDRIPHASS